jgi:broad specificity phosphatase PhoE
MKVYLARHGRTNYNDLGLCNADPTVDVHLTPTGVMQAEALADKFKHSQIDRIFASELKRTQQTAGIINQFHGLKIEVDPRLNDGRSGFEGKHFKDYDEALDAATNKWTARFNGGESIEDMKKRAAEFVEDLRIRNYESVIIITSQWIIQTIVAVVRGITNEEAWSLEVNQGSCMELEI